MLSDSESIEYVDATSFSFIYVYLQHIPNSFHYVHNAFRSYTNLP